MGQPSAKTKKNLPANISNWVRGALTYTIKSS